MLKVLIGYEVHEKNIRLLCSEERGRVSLGLWAESILVICICFFAEISVCARVGDGISFNIVY